MKKHVILVSGSLLIFAGGCAGSIDDSELVENAVVSSALSSGEPEELDDVPNGTINDSADEVADIEAGGEGEEFQRSCDLGAIRDRIVARYDRDGDGQLNQREHRQLEGDFGEHPMQRQRWARFHRFMRLKWVYDADENRALDEGERQEMRNDLEMRCQNRYQKLLQNHDADGDGQLGEAEWAAIKAQHQARVQARHQAMLAQFDTNGDGQLNAAEKMALVQARRQQFEQRRTALQAQYDADGSGDLDAGERAAAREAAKARVRGEHFTDPV